MNATDLKRDVARFLTQATYGPTNAEITALANSITTTYSNNRIAGYNAWIDAQFALPQTKLYDFTIASDQLEWNQVGNGVNLYTHTAPSTFGNHPDTTNRRHAWWTISINANDQLRQRVAFALSEIFVTSTGDSTLGNYHYGQCNYYDMLASYADSNFLNLLRSVTLHPVMGEYLSSLQNQKTTTDGSGNVLTSPDENYAREVMQLFTIGLVKLNPDGSVITNGGNNPVPTYVNTDVSELARVLTGWSFSQADSATAAITNTNFFASAGNRYFQSSWLAPMSNFATYHDTGSKTLLTFTIPAGADGPTDLTNALNIIFNHQNVGPFIARRLIQRMVTSNPSAGYVYRVAQKFADNGSGVRGDMKAVVKAILTDYEARDLPTADGSQYGKQKEPLLRYMQIVRAVRGHSPVPLSALTAVGYSQAANFRSGTTVLRFPNSTGDLGQTAFEAPSVFNWFLPDYTPNGVIPTGMVVPEMQLTTAPQVFSSVNYIYVITQSATGKAGDWMYNQNAYQVNISLDPSSLQGVYHTAIIQTGGTVLSATTALMDYLDDTLMAGEMKRYYPTYNPTYGPAQDPRSAIISAVSNDSFTSDTAGETSRAREMLYLISSSATFIHQK